MALSGFITQLLETGKVSLQAQFIAVDEANENRTKEILLNYYHDDKTELPYEAPPFSEEVALWAAKYFYNAVQLTVLRDLGEEVINAQLTRFNGGRNASAIYSADLVLRYLPQLFDLAKGLAPSDLLVSHLRQTALDWPYSSVGMKLDQPVADHVILGERSLRYSYIDRIIRQKDKHRLTNPEVVNYIHELLGEQLAVFWPEFEKHKTTVDGISNVEAN